MLYYFFLLLNVWQEKIQENIRRRKSRKKLAGKIGLKCFLFADFFYRKRKLKEKIREKQGAENPGKFCQIPKNSGDFNILAIIAIFKTLS